MGEWWSDSESWGLVLGFFTPLLAAVVQQPHWSKTARWLVGWGCALVVGLLTVLAAGEWGDGPTMLRTVALTLLAAQTAYQGWKHGVTPVIEQATSPRERRNPPAGGGL